MSKKKRTGCSSISSSASNPLYAFFEDRQAREGQPAAWVFERPVGSLEIIDLPSLNAALAEIETGTHWWVAALDYELGYLLEPAAAPPGWQPSGQRPLARFWRFADGRQLDETAAAAWLQSHLDALPADERMAGIGGLSARLTEADYRRGLGHIQDYIAAGDCYQVNYTFPLGFDWFGHPLALYAALRGRQPVRYGGFVGSAEEGIVSLSPELFVERRGDRLLTRPMKGTAPRSVDPDELRTSEKNRAENLMIVDLLRNDLGRIAVPGSVQVDALFDIEAYPTLWQMVSQISARAPQAGFSHILRALFPCGSITGAPKIRAMQIAAEQEAEARGLYTGALGWIAPGGDFRLNVAIRTLELKSGRRGRMGIGSGVVADSDAGDEWRECLLKSRFLAELDPGLELIETLRLENGLWPRLAGHLERLRRSAAWLGYPCDEASVRRALAALPERDEKGTCRVRLALNKAGRLSVTAAALAPEPAGPRFARLADVAIDSRNPLRRHKTTAREIYDRALKEIAAEPAVFDVLFLNERGEVAEGARSNVFLERGGRLLTPPLASGALPGVLRAELLASGRAEECILYPADLAGGFLLGNALRGLVPVSLLSA